jgi:hypothetical protein
MRPWSKFGVLFFLFAVALLLVPADALAWEDEDEGGGDDGEDEDGGEPVDTCGPIDPDTPCYPTGGGSGTKCTGIGGCNNCVRDPFTLNYKSCKFTDDQDGVCKCWPAGYGACSTSGTCTYLRYGT